MKRKPENAGRSRGAAFRGGLASLVATACLAALFTSCPAAGIVGGSAYLSDLKTFAPDLSALPDGVYSAKASVAVPLGSTAAFPWAEAEVRIASHAYSAVKLRGPASMVDDPKFLALAARVVAANSLEVDVVSGATFTSKAFLEAIAKAVTP